MGAAHRRGLGGRRRSIAQDDATLLIEIEYTVRATNSRYNLVYPFYLAS